jgi:molybdopterin synthase catalytic subunit
VELEVRLFAGLREAVGRDRVSVALAEGARVEDLVLALARAHAPLEKHRGRYAVAVNLAIAAPDQVLRAGDEVALLPPVGGGTGDDLLELTRAPIDLAKLVRFATHPGAGGVSIFMGTARDVHEGKSVLSLEYEAYDAMALASFDEIARATRSQLQTVKRLAISHRLGLVPIGEASVVVVASAPHRKESFAACRFAIDELKAKAPIWKKEALAAGGERWVANAEPGAKG